MQARPASRATVGGFRPPDDPLTSWFGGVRVAGPGEEWPLGLELPMFPICQLNLTEAPYRPDALSDIALITVFLERYGFPDLGAPNGHGWVLRAYESLDGLVELDRPTDVGDVRPFPIRWELVEEGPEEEDEAFWGTKLGGWPAEVQAELYWAPYAAHPAEPEYVLQLGSEEKSNWSWGDGGVAYIGRGTGGHRDQWAIEIQFY